MYESLAQNLFLAIWSIEPRNVHLCSRIHYVHCHGAAILHVEPTRSSSMGYHDVELLADTLACYVEERKG